MAQSKELVAASATPMILAVLSRGDSYGYAIIQEIKGAIREPDRMDRRDALPRSAPLGKPGIRRVGMACGRIGEEETLLPNPQDGSEGAQ